MARLLLSTLIAVTLTVTGPAFARSWKVAVVTSPDSLPDAVSAMLSTLDAVESICPMPTGPLLDPTATGSSYLSRLRTRTLREGCDALLLVRWSLRPARLPAALRGAPLVPWLNAAAHLLGRPVEHRLEVCLLRAGSGREIARHVATRTVRFRPADVAGRLARMRLNLLDQLLSEVRTELAARLECGTQEPKGRYSDALVRSDGPAHLTTQSLERDPYWTASPGGPRPPWRPDRFLVGLGDRYDDYTEGGYRVWWREAHKQNLTVNAHGIWIPRNFQTDWLSRDKLVEMSRAGVTPVLLLYYFGDDVSRENVSAWYSDYRQWLQRVLKHFRGDYPVLVVLEPEFNNVPDKGSHVKNWAPFGRLMIQAAAEVRYYLPGARVGICPGDFRAYDLQGVLGPVSRHMDFLAFQELWAATRPHNLTSDTEDVTEHALLFTNYLSLVYERPVLLAYLGVSTFQPEGEPLDWEQVQARIWSRFGDRLGDFRKAGLFGVLAFAQYDDPGHGGWFGPAEVAWGIFHHGGAAKAAVASFRKLLEQARH